MVTSDDAADQGAAMSPLTILATQFRSLVTRVQIGTAVVSAALGAPVVAAGEGPPSETPVATEADLLLRHTPAERQLARERNRLRNADPGPHGAAPRLGHVLGVGHVDDIQVVVRADLGDALARGLPHLPGRSDGRVPRDGVLLHDIERRAGQEAEAAFEAMQATTQEVLRRVRVGYAKYYLAARSLEVNAETTKLARAFTAIADAKYRVGDAPQQDVIQAQEQLSRLAAERVGFEGDLPAAQRALNALLDRPPRAPLGPAGELDAREVEVALDALVALADHSQPELRAQDHVIEARRRSLTLAKMGFLPDFTIGGQYTQVGDGTNPEFTKDGQDIWSASLGFSVPIWINRVQAGVNEARAQAMGEEFRRRDLANQVFDELQRAYERVAVAARVERIYTLTLLPQTQARIGSARAAYQTGQVDFFTLIDSLTSFQDVRLKRYRAVRDYQRALADLERAVGQPISPVGAASEQEFNPEK